VPPPPPPRERERRGDTSNMKREKSTDSGRGDVINPKQHLNLLADDLSGFRTGGGAITGSKTPPPVSPMKVAGLHSHRRKPPRPPSDPKHDKKLVSTHEETKAEEFGYEAYQVKESPFAYLNDIDSLTKKGPPRATNMKSPKKLLVKLDESKSPSNAHAHIRTTASASSLAAEADDAKMQETEEEEVKPVHTNEVSFCFPPFPYFAYSLQSLLPVSSFANLTLSHVIEPPPPQQKKRELQDGYTE